MKKAMKTLIFTMILMVGLTTAIAQPVSAKSSSSKAKAAVNAYNSFVKTKKYKKYTKTTKKISFMADESGKKKYNYLPDLNKDGVPELILLNEKKGTYYVFTCKNNKVKYVKKMGAKYKADNPIELFYHKSKKQMWMTEMDMSKLMDMLTKLIESEGEVPDQNALTKQLLDAMNIRFRESAYKVSKSGLKITKGKSTVLSIKATQSGAVVIKLNGKERLRCTISINGKKLDQLDGNDTNMKFDSMQLDFSAPNNKNKLSCVVALGGYTAEQIMNMESDELEKKMTQEYYYAGNKVSEKVFEGKFDKMIKFMTSMKTTSGDKKIVGLIAYPVSKKGLVK